MGFDISDTLKFSDIEIVAKTCWGEFRSGGRYGLQSVANVIMNRADSNIRWWGGPDARSICLKPFQFSCWLPKDPNRPKLIAATESDPVYAVAIEIATLALANKLDDIVASADSYLDHRMPVESWPPWARSREPVKIIEPHFYFRTYQDN